jgi:metallophosphoesterase (TIGR00282 family)
VKVLMLGDVVGRPGRAALKKRLPALREEFGPDLVVANAENASGGLGLSAKNARELLALGLDAMTTGNHVWKFRDLYNVLNTEPRLLRPANYPPGAPGRGAGVFTTASGVRVGVLNLLGRTYMPPVDCPFRAADELLEGLAGGADVIVADFHAEATSEKAAMAHHLAGRAALLAGTHTHVQTSDARVLPGGLAFITDLGMCGPTDSCLGMKAEPIVGMFLSGLPTRFEVSGGPARVQGALAEIDETTGRALAVRAIDLPGE